VACCSLRVRHCPWLWCEESPRAAATRGLVLMGTIRLQKDPRWREMVARFVACCEDVGERAVWSKASTASPRMHQSRHRRMTQGLLDLKRCTGTCEHFAPAAPRQVTLRSARPQSAHRRLVAAPPIASRPIGPTSVHTIASGWESPGRKRR